MWMIQIMEDESDTAQAPYDGLPAFLAVQDIPPEVIRRGLDQLRQRKSLRLYKLSEEREWEIGEA